jgi:hypothetical protein
MSSPPPENERLCLELINKIRDEYGKSPLVYNKKISDIAATLTEAIIAKKQPVGHDGYKERFQKVQDLFFLPHMPMIAENVGFHQGEQEPIKALVAQWRAQPPSHKNQLNDFTQVGISIGHVEDVYVGAVIFADV